jgi:hypothetical protein
MIYPARVPRHSSEVAIVGGGPAGMTTALLLARTGHHVTIFERSRELGGLWACELDDHGHYRGENSCKVYQPSYRTAPALFAAIGERWEDHFVARHDLVRDWLWPFLGDASALDLAKLGASFVRHLGGGNRNESVADYLESHAISERCRAWMRATALGGVTGTMRMTMGELFRRLESNVGSIVSGDGGALYWNARPPNARDGFLRAWTRALERSGVTIETGVDIERIEVESGRIRLRARGLDHHADAAHLAIPPPALARLLGASPTSVAESFGHDRDALDEVLRDSQYAHLGIAWFFDRPLPRDLPLGGHRVRCGWHPILVQHSQYRAHLRPPAVTVVVGSVSLDTELRHDRLGTRARDHAHDELARILWDDERRTDPSLPEPIDVTTAGVSSATQIVGHGPLPLRARGHEIYLATSLNGHAAYFTASLEAAIQAGESAARAQDPTVRPLLATAREAIRPHARRARPAFAAEAFRR